MRGVCTKHLHHLWSSQPFGELAGFTPLPLPTHWGLWSDSQLVSWGSARRQPVLRTGGPTSVFRPGAVRLTFHEFYQSLFPDNFQNVIIVSFRLTFLRREQRCFPRVWTASYPPSQTWFKGNAVLWFESPLPFVSSPESVFLQGGGRAPQSPPTPNTSTP